ncbi:MAG: hypothetical protein R3D33_14035 [Hyphomicrobiaceae bacterium]
MKKLAIATAALAISGLAAIGSASAAGVPQMSTVAGAGDSSLQLVKGYWKHGCWYEYVASSGTTASARSGAIAGSTARVAAPTAATDRHRPDDPGGRSG